MDAGEYALGGLAYAYRGSYRTNDDCIMWMSHMKDSRIGGPVGALGPYGGHEHVTQFHGSPHRDREQPQENHDAAEQLPEQAVTSR